MSEFLTTVSWPGAIIIVAVILAVAAIVIAKGE